MIDNDEIMLENCYISILENYDDDNGMPTVAVPREPNLETYFYKFFKELGEAELRWLAINSAKPDVIVAGPNINIGSGKLKGGVPLNEVPIEEALPVLQGALERYGYDLAKWQHRTFEPAFPTK